MDQSVGRLAFSVGETLLSSWEAARLGPGDIVLSTRQAGYPGFLLFNNLPLGIGEVVIFDGTFGVRVADSDFRPPFLVDPGRIDELGELVPAVIELGAIGVSLDQLRGLGRNSFVNLGVPAAGPDDGVLMYAGIPLARGKVVVVGELMGLRIRERLADLPVPDQVRQSGNLADRVSAARAKDYNFAMPDKWTWEQIRKLEDIHRLFQRNLEASLPAVARELDRRIEGLFLDQCTLGEARAFLAKAGLPGYRTWDHEGPRRGRREEPVRPRSLWVEAADCPRPLSEGTKAFIGALFADGGLLGRRPVFLHPGSGLTEADFGVLADCLRNGWKRVLDFRIVPEPAAAEGSGPSRDLADHEMVILVVLRQDADSVPVLGIVYPFLTLEPYMQVLGS